MEKQIPSTYERVSKPLRQSGVELLKIIGIILVIISHVVQTLTTGSAEWAIDIYKGIRDPITFIVAFLRYSGALGNILFFTCSAWYLLDKEKTNYQKVMRMVFDILTISLIWLIPILIWKKGELDAGMIFRCFFPTYYNNNWYMTSYILFCFVYPVLNLLIKHLSQRKHLILAISLFIAYFVLSFIYFFPWSNIASFWITLYFVLSYFRKYGLRICESKTINIIILFSSIALHVLLLFLSNYLLIEKGMVGIMNWYYNNNPLLFLIAFSSLNLMRMCKFSSKVINYVSSLSMLIYVIHENILFRTYLRPLIWEAIYKN